MNLRLIPLCLFVIISCFPLFSFARSISSSELIKDAKEYDGKSVVYTGEAIGDVMRRGEYAWVNIKDGDAALGVWMSEALAKEINYTGSYKSSGDKIEITGIFHRACPEHGADLDIHAQSIRKIENGGLIARRMDPSKRNLILILGGVLVLIWILSLFRRR